MKKNNGKRNVQFLAAAALTAALMAGQIQPAAVYGSENLSLIHISFHLLVSG